MATSTQSAIIIGVGPFVSRSVSLYLAGQNYQIGLISRTEANIDKLATELRDNGSTVHTQAADAGNAASLESALDTLATKLGGVDVLVYNAARVGPNDLMTTNPEVFEQDFKTAATGTLVAGQWFSKHANTASDTRPLLIITGGVLDREPNADYASLSAVKAASQSISKMFSQVLPEKYGIQVGMPLIVEPIIPKEGGGYVTKSDPDVIVKQIFKPFFDAREKREYKDWVTERIH